MTTDITRSTFLPAKHYSGVRLQQGRVQVDADWNEQVDIETYRGETVVGDLIGACGVPRVNPGFAISSDPASLPADEQQRLTDLGILPLAPGTFLIGAGRAYVDGVLCENDQTVSFTTQPDLPGVTPITSAGLYLVYLRVWQRPITALEDPAIREIALDGPDTATRTKTVWQVGVLDVSAESANAHCLTTFTAWDNLVGAARGRLTARGEPQGATTGPCIVPPDAGFRRLENQLYRVEIHRGSDDANGATFKWSRINGSCVRAWTGQAGANDEEMAVEGTGPDDVLGFAGGRSIELTDDSRELQHRPGTIVELIRVDGNTLVINPDSRLVAADSILRTDFTSGPKARRWDSPGERIVEVPATNGGFIPLEDGVEIKFEANTTYRSGDYWLIPARTLSGDIEWPRDNGTEQPQVPHGVEYQFCRLALLDADATPVLTPRDCRPIFPPVTELTSLFYVGGDGQEATPNPTMPTAFLPLPHPLQVGVANGGTPVEGAKVRFSMVTGQGNGRLGGVQVPLNTMTGADGTATCAWELDSTTPVQQIEAILLDAAEQPIHLPVRFTARLNLATAAAYDPSSCDDLAAAGAVTVQTAIDELCRRDSGGESDPGIHIETIRLNTDEPLINDGEVVFQIFLGGFFVILDGIPDPATVTRPTCYVTIEMPFPLQSDEFETWGSTLLGYKAITLEAALEVTDQRIQWTPAGDLHEFFQRLFGMMAEMGFGERVLARFTLKGNFIFTEGAELYLDGEVFGAPAGTTEHNLILPSGDGHRGGDFETWFWLNNRG